MSCDLKLDDLLELSKVYAPEYNMPELHDRVLVFDVMQDGWETDGILASNEDSDDLENADENPGENSMTVAKEAPKDGKNSSNAENKVSVAVESNEIKPEVEQNIETGSTSGQDSSTSLNSELQNETDPLVASDENQIVEASPTDAIENLGHAKKGILRQHKIFVHSSWLAVQSKYFRSLFYSGMKESGHKEVHVKVSECEEATHLMLLESIYKADILNGATVEELLTVLELADKYDVKFVFKKCKYVLQTRVTTVDICKQVMHVIKEKHSFGDVEDLAATMQIAMGENFTPLENHWQTERFTSQSQPFVQYLLASTQLQACCENTVFQALMHWMEVNNVDPTSLEKDCGLLKSVRFEKLTIDYLYNVVRAHPIASQMPGFQDLMLQGMTYHALSPELKQRLTEVTPRPRQINASTPQFTWKIPKAQLFTYNSTRLASEKFWLCGYKADMQVQFSSGSASQPYYNVNVYLSLELTSKNYFPLSWKVNGCACTCNFISGSCPGVHVSFNKNAVSDPVSITITVDEPQ